MFTARAFRLVQRVHLGPLKQGKPTLVKTSELANRNGRLSFVYTSAHYNSRRAMAGEGGGPIEVAIKEKLMAQFQPSHLEVINESYMHNVPRGSETHFKVVVISQAFENESLIKRHRLVNAALQAELDGPVHALSIQAKTPSQWAGNSTITKSPPCLGGMAREQREQQKT
ncbi:bolA-like protein DDB_G0274169 [Diadema antillarum]|uniref:bolA-like protein DDB_G0274169 n=1 Tax=Diadema antillarum TaxID=105358 RepID=UPI003A869F14